jgi:peptidoglycan/xylan/chitin deacetylase (PgdA/CDA1 family)
MSTLVSVDLDDVACYHAIHGLAPPAPDADRVALERCLPRFLELFAAHGTTATFFVIGRDLGRDRAAGGVGATLLARAHAAGHELGNHSFAHDYRLASWDGARIAEDLRACDRLLREVGAVPVGFRAPGYTHDRRLLAQVAGLGYRYDSSSLPSPAYYLAKLGVMGLMRVRGRRSASSVSGMSAFFGATGPHYRPDVGLWEVPISVSPVLRLPLIGTTLLAGPDRVADRLRREAARAAHLHLELHAIDLADETADGLAPELCAVAPELRTPLSIRRRRLVELLEARGPGSSIIRALGH